MAELVDECDDPADEGIQREEGDYRLHRFCIGGVTPRLKR
jgi:hypothetical protein